MIWPPASNIAASGALTREHLVAAERIAGADVLQMTNLDMLLFTGCRWLSMETAEETLEKPSYSLRNARKMGFEILYLRPNYLGSAGMG
jgi:hypothetical protein